MRRHMVNKHGMSREAVDRITNKRKSAMDMLAQRLASAVEGESASAAPLAGPPYSDAF